MLLDCTGLDFQYGIANLNPYDASSQTKLYHLSDYETAFGMVGKGYKVAFDCRLDDDDDEEEEGKEEEENEGKKV